MRTIICARMTDRQSEDSPGEPRPQIKPPSDPRIRAFCDALAEALAHQLAAEIRAGKLPGLTKEKQ